MFSIIRDFLANEDGFLQFLAPVVGGLLGASASRSAAKTQAGATRDAEARTAINSIISGAE